MATVEWEWYLNSFRLRTPQTRRDAFFRSLDQYPDLHYTFHLPTVDVELAHGNLLIAEASLRYMQLYIEYLAPWLQQQSEPQIITLHVGSNSIPWRSWIGILPSATWRNWGGSPRSATAWSSWKTSRWVGPPIPHPPGDDPAGGAEGPYL